MGVAENVNTFLPVFLNSRAQIAVSREERAIIGSGAARRKAAPAMSKPSHLLRKIKAQNEAKYDYLFRKKIDMAMQIVQDAAFLAAADVFQMGPGRCEAFGAAIRDYVNEIASTMCTDQEGDPEYVYTREKVDQRMRKICGDKFEPWEVRYGETK